MTDREKEILKIIAEFEKKYDLKIDPDLISALLTDYRLKIGYRVIR